MGRRDPLHCRPARRRLPGARSTIRIRRPISARVPRVVVAVRRHGQLALAAPLALGRDGAVQLPSDQPAATQTAKALPAPQADDDDGSGA